MGRIQAVKKKRKWMDAQLEYSSLKLIDHKAKNSYAYEIKEIQKGYQVMAEINLGLSELCFAVESEVEQFFEERIAESE